MPGWQSVPPARGRVLRLPALPGPLPAVPSCRGLSPGLAGREASSSHIYISSASSSKEYFPGTCLPRALGTGPGRHCNREGLASPTLPPTGPWTRGASSPSPGASERRAPPGLRVRQTRRRLPARGTREQLAASVNFCAGFTSASVLKTPFACWGKSAGRGLALVSATGAPTRGHWPCPGCDSATPALGGGEPSLCHLTTSCVTHSELLNLSGLDFHICENEATSVLLGGCSEN